MIVRERLADYHFFSTCVIVEPRSFCYAVCMMEKRQRVILFGDSLILAGVRASLEANPGIETLTLDQPLDGPLEELHRLRPAAVIFDLSAVQLDSLLSLLQQPDLLLIGIDPETHQVLVWSGKKASAEAATDLVNVIPTNSIWRRR